MKKLILFATAGLLFFSCKKEEMIQNQKNESEKMFLTKATTKLSALAKGAEQISGIGFYATPSECEGGQGATYSVKMTGDFEGCLYVFIDKYTCSPSGTYREIGRERFVGTYQGKSGTFWTNYKFESKFEGCAADGSYLGAEIFGRCQHPIVKGSGTGIFEGVTGRLDFKDDVEAGNFPYIGHIM